MKRIERDFITIFNCLWYRDFPVTETHDLAGRTDWTIHLGLVIRQCASLLGARALFEQGGRTDAVIRFPEGDILSFVEWEWSQAHTDINEIEKLLQRESQALFLTLIGYSSLNHIQATLDRIQKIWLKSSKPLIFFLITFESKKSNRHFMELQTYFFHKGKFKKIRSQPALPWRVNRTKLTSISDN